MAEVKLCSWSEISQACEGLQLNPTAATLEHILARFTRLETRLVEYERRVAATLPPLQPDPDPPDRPRLYAASQPQPPIHRQPSPPYQPDSPTSTMDCYYLLSHTYDKQCWNQPPQPVHPRRTTCWDLPDCGNLSYGYQQTPTYAPEPYPYAYNPPRQQGYPGYDQPPPRLPTSWDPQGPSCWYPPTPAFEQPSYTYIDSYAPLQISYTGDHREQPDSQPPRLPYTDSESLVQPINCSSGYYLWQLENSPSRQLPLPDLPLHLPSPPLPSHCRSAALLPTLAPPPPPLQHNFHTQPPPSHDYHQPPKLSSQQPLLTAALPRQNYSQVPHPKTYQPLPPPLILDCDRVKEGFADSTKNILDSLAGFGRVETVEKMEKSSPDSACKEKPVQGCIEVECSRQLNASRIKILQSQIDLGDSIVDNASLELLGDVAGMNHRPTLLDGDAWLIPPRNDTLYLSVLGRVDNLSILALNFDNHIGPPLMIFDRDEEGRRFPIRCAFDPGGNSSPKLLFVMLFIVSWFPP